MRSISGCSRPGFPNVAFSLRQSVVCFAPGRPYNSPPRNPPLRTPCTDAPISRGSVLKVVFWLLLFCCKKKRFACPELLSGPGLPAEWVHARSYFKPPCYCSAAAKNHSACPELLFGPGLLTERVHTRFEFNLPRYCSAAAKSRFACTELLSGPGLSTDRAHACFELKLPCYCSSVAANSLFACTELLSGPGLPTERVHARFGLKTAPPPFYCCDISFLLHRTARSAAGFANARLFEISVGRVKCDVSDTVASLDSVVAFCGKNIIRHLTVKPTMAVCDIVPV